MLGDRIKAALDAHKARTGDSRPGRGPKPEVRARGLENAQKAIRARADAAYAELAPTIVELRAEGLSLQAIADVLNGEGHRTRRGKAWNAVQVSRVLRRALAIRAEPSA